MKKCFDMVQNVTILRVQNRDQRLAGYTVEADKEIFFAFNAFSLNTSFQNGHKSRRIIGCWPKICLFSWTVKYCQAISKNLENERLVAENLTWSYDKFLVTDWGPAIIFQVAFFVVENKRGQGSFSKEEGNNLWWNYLCFSKPFWEKNFGNFSAYFQRRNIELIVITTGQALDKFICWWDFCFPVFLLFQFILLVK